MEFLPELNFKELVDKINGIYNSTMSDKEKYDLIFSDEDDTEDLARNIANYIKSEYYDPPEYYGEVEDIHAYVRELNSMMLYYNEGDDSFDFRPEEVVGDKWNYDAILKVEIVHKEKRCTVVDFPYCSITEPNSCLLKVPNQTKAIREYNDKLYTRIKEIQDGIIKSGIIYIPKKIN